jgi:hypothetical protein
LNLIADGKRRSLFDEFAVERRRIRRAEIKDIEIAAVF